MQHVPQLLEESVDTTNATKGIIPMRVSAVFALVLAAILAMTPGCSKKPASGSAELGSATGTAAGVKWSVPKRWTVAPARQMRVVTYAIPASDSDTTGAECAVSFFGTGQGGPVEMNIERWKGQFENPEVGQQARREIGGVKVTTVKITGTYLSPGGMMMTPGEPKRDYGMLGAVVEAPEGMLFFKLTGPKGTVDAAAAEYEAMLGSIAK